MSWPACSRSSSRCRSRRCIFRLRGGYFAIGTWVVAEVVRLIVRQHPGHGRRLRQDGHLRRPSPDRPRASPAPTGWRWSSPSGSILLVYFLLRSRLGLALTAIRDNDLAAQSSGVNVFRSKLFVYVIAAFGCGVVGAVVAMNLLRIQPAAAFSINWTAYAIFIVVIGGFGTIEGPIIGAVIYFALLQTLSQYGTTYMLLLGVIAVIMATKAPARHLGLRRQALGPAPVPGAAPAGAGGAAAGEDLKPPTTPDAAVGGVRLRPATWRDGAGGRGTPAPTPHGRSPRERRVRRGPRPPE